MWQTLQDLNYADVGDIQVTDDINIDLYKQALDELIEEHPDSVLQQDIPWNVMSNTIAKC